MRDMRFRCWDKNAKEFVDDVIMDSHGNHYQFNKCEFWGDDRDIEIMRYTGLHDADGKEIFEGDIIKGNVSHPMEVIFIKNGWYIKFYDLGESICEQITNDLFENYEPVIIGNIHQHADLLGNGKG
jgi:uncharacterized phage protein (TIGR01671 family)